MTTTTFVGINPDKPVTLNGQTLAPVVNPENRMQVIIPVALQSYTDYTLVIPDGAFHRSDDPKVMAEGMTITFNTNTGVNVANLAQSLINPNATPKPKSLPVTRPTTMATNSSQELWVK